MKRFVGSALRCVDALAILESSQDTLKEVKLDNIKGEVRVNTSFKLGLQLTELESIQISSSVILVILQSLKAPLNKLGMVTLYYKKNYKNSLSFLSSDDILGLVLSFC